ncbi:TetR/AcrR family transcriptional regulator [Erwiniaceae bacterium CAU 1747]
MLGLTSTRARTRRLLIETAMRLFDSGAFPSITEVAHEAQLSRATAYRYFPTQSALVSAIVSETFGPVKNWQPARQDANGRIDELFSFAFPRMLRHEGTLRAALHLSLTQWAQEQADDTLTIKEKLARDGRKTILTRVIKPLNDELPPELVERVVRSLSLVYGLEIFLVMKDIWGCNNDEVEDIGKWIARAIVRQAREDAQRV